MRSNSMWRDPPHGPHVHWVQPRLVAEIAYGEWTQNGLLRQPRFEGLRPDKKPHECRRERPQPVHSGAAEAWQIAGGRQKK